MGRVLLSFFYVGILGLSLFFFLSEWKGQHVLAKKIPEETARYYQLILDKDRVSTNRLSEGEALINAPLIDQKPELARGCEVTSLAMLLQTAGVHVGKLELATKIKKDPAPYINRGGSIYFGNPNAGFVGNMYNEDQPGYAVYHGPLFALEKKYIGQRAIDLTGKPFEAVLSQLDQGKPVLVITSTTYEKVPASEWQTWHTKEGTIRVTRKEHAVLITGYTSTKLFLNDPLNTTKNVRTDRKAFIEAWNQFGGQALSYR
ncbi:MAG TPA: C39 family peptidase [Candidatus Angelobacter sp.]|nr:C39 family peptidase [Candidatus Angelobacter sp.]